jgi:hypothetical protein
VASSTHIRGLEEALRVLKELDPALYKESRKRIKADAKPLVQAAKDKLPQVPMSGWGVAAARQQDMKGRKTLRTSSGFPIYNPASAKRGVTVSIRSKGARGFSGKGLLVAMVQNDAGGMIFDYASKSTNNNLFPRGLSKRNPEPSRYMWKAAEENMGSVRDSLQRSISEVERQFNRRLRS